MQPNPRRQDPHPLRQPPPQLPTGAAQQRQSKLLAVGKGIADEVLSRSVRRQQFCAGLRHQQDHGVVSTEGPPSIFCCAMIFFPSDSVAPVIFGAMTSRSVPSSRTLSSRPRTIRRLVPRAIQNVGAGAGGPNTVSRLPRPAHMACSTVLTGTR